MSFTVALPGRPSRRYVGAGVFLVALLVLYRLLDVGGRRPRRLGLGFRLPTPAGVERLDYRPSSIDWSQEKTWFPVRDLLLPPSGAPVKLPRVQARRGAAGEAERRAGEERRAAVRAKALKSWQAYRAHAWGQDELMPLSGGGQATLAGWGAQVVDALDTLWIMGLRDEFREGVRHVAQVDFGRYAGDSLDVFEVTIRYLGGLLAAHDLSGEPALLAKAVELGDALYGAFDTPNRLVVGHLDYGQVRAGAQEAAELTSAVSGGSLCMEFTRLSQLTGDPRYYDATERIKRLLHETQGRTRVPGLWPRYLNFRDGNMTWDMFTLGAGADSLYEYLPKMHALLGGLDPAYSAMTERALDTARERLLFRPTTPDEADVLMLGNLVARSSSPERSYEMQHLACYAGGMYALAGRLLERDDFVDTGARLTRGCVWLYDAFPTRIMPESAEMVPCDVDGGGRSSGAAAVGPCPWAGAELMHSVFGDHGLPEGIARVVSGSYLLRPEAIESIFYMWRITGDEAWREAAWRMWEAVVRETETETAFATLRDVNVVGGPKGDSMEVSCFLFLLSFFGGTSARARARERETESGRPAACLLLAAACSPLTRLGPPQTFWLGETLKYFYLVFEDERVIDLDEWVLNTEAHPFRRP